MFCVCMMRQRRYFEGNCMTDEETGLWRQERIKCWRWSARSYKVSKYSISSRCLIMRACVWISTLPTMSSDSIQLSQTRFYYTISQSEMSVLSVFFASCFKFHHQIENCEKSEDFVKQTFQFCYHISWRWSRL